MAVMIVEDDVGVREGLATLLDGEGFDVIAVADGETALRVMDEKGPPEVVVIDLVLPGMSGTQLIREVRRSEKLAATPLMILSAVPPTKIHAPPDVLVLSKPLFFEALFSRLHQLCDEKKKKGPSVADCGAPGPAPFARSVR